MRGLSVAVLGLCLAFILVAGCCAPPPQVCGPCRVPPAAPPVMCPAPNRYAEPMHPYFDPDGQYRIVPQSTLRDWMQAPSP